MDERLPLVDLVALWWYQRKVKKAFSGTVLGAPYSVAVGCKGERGATTVYDRQCVLVIIIIIGLIIIIIIIIGLITIIIIIIIIIGLIIIIIIIIKKYV